MGRLWLAIVIAALSAACTNNPYPPGDSAKKVYYTSFVEAPKTLDPAVAYTTTEHEITGPVYESLLEYHYLKRPYELIPSLATHVPKAETHADGRVSYVFELRPGMLFQEDRAFELGGAGRRTREITAQDFVFELMRIADPAVNSPVVEPFSNLQGFAEFSEKLGKRRKQDAAFAKMRAHEQYEAVGGFAGARVIDATHFEITLTKAYPQILFWFAMPFTTPVPWEAIELYDGRDGREQFADHPVGCGPYKLTHYHKQSRMVLERNENWYGIRHPDWRAPGATFPSEGEPDDAAHGYLKAAGKALPFIERVEFRREKEKIPAFNKFLQGYYDASGIIRESFDRVVRDDRLSPEMQKLGMKLDKSVTASVFYIGFNMDDPVVGSKAGERSRKLRQAMSLAIDVKEYTRLFMNGRGVPAQSLMPPGLFGYEESYVNPYRTVDLERAKRLLAEAGFENGVDSKTGRPLHLTFDISDTSAEGRPRFQFHVNQWRKIGIDVELSATNYNKFQQKVRDGAYQIFQWGWVADYPDAENFMFLLWSEMSRRKNNGPNTANFTNAEFDRLFLQMKARDNDLERMEMLRKMRDIVAEERPWIELFHLEDYALYHGWYSNVKPAGLSIPTLKYHDLDPVLRKEKRELWNKPVLWPAYLVALFLAIVIAPGVRTFFRERQ